MSHYAPRFPKSLVNVAHNYQSGNAVLAAPFICPKFELRPSSLILRKRVRNSTR
jgi:hypothetical protein